MKNYNKSDRSGDQGMTSCPKLGIGLVQKTNPRIVLLGKLDFLSAKLITSIHCAPLPNIPTTKVLKEIHDQIFELSTHLAYKPREIENLILRLEDLISDYTPEDDIGMTWYKPRTMYACMINEARCIARECEILAWQATSGNVCTYLNRLSDLLFFVVMDTEKYKS